MSSLSIFWTCSCITSLSVYLLGHARGNINTKRANSSPHVDVRCIKKVWSAFIVKVCFLKSSPKRTTIVFEHRIRVQSKSRCLDYFHTCTVQAVSCSLDVHVTVTLTYWPLRVGFTLKYFANECHPFVTHLSMKPADA